MRSLVLLALSLPAVAGAQGIILPRCPRPIPDRPIVECLPTAQQVVRTRSDVRVELRDRVLRYEVEERFVNRGGMIGEADYIFPLPKNAAFRDLKLSINGEMVAGETMGAAEARRIYEDIVRRQRDPALVEWMGHGMLRTRIFPIQPGEERRIVVRYESVAEREGDAVRVDYFTGSRLSAFGSRQDPWQTLPAEGRGPTADGAVGFTLTYRAGGELGEAYSPTHELDIERDGVARRVAVRNGGNDITILVALRRSTDASVALLANANRGEPGYALITVTPPADVASQRLPRDVTFVIDVSGSMSGRKLEQAKAAGRQLLRTLGERDRFRLIDFSTDVRSFRDDFVFATDANISAALEYLDRLDASGSTNISGALEAALGARPSAPGSRLSADSASAADGRWPMANGRGRLPVVLFMTDGAPTVGDRDPASIAARAARLRGDARVFTFGVGADLNVGLIEQLALEGHGTAHFVRPEESVERAVELVATRLRAPLLTDVRVSVDGGVRLTRVYPDGPQDIFAGQDLVLLARYDGSGSANVVVTGRAGDRAVRWTSARNFPADERENAFVPRLWATQRIGWLAAEKRKNGGSGEIDDEIRRLGERFGIPTEFTSYIVTEPGLVAQRRFDRGRMDQVMTSGMASGGAGVAAAPAPAVAQFEAARAASDQRAAKSMAAADMASHLGGETRRAGNRLFTRDGDRWVDTRFKSGLKVYKVKAYSQTYFTLLLERPELRDAFAVGEQVVVAGQSAAVEVVPDAPELTPGELRSALQGLGPGAYGS